MGDYKNSDMCNAIQEYVRNPRYRDLLQRRYCEGQTYDQISAAVNYSPQHVKHICKIYREILMNHL